MLAVISMPSTIRTAIGAKSTPRRPHLDARRLQAKTDSRCGDAESADPSLGAAASEQRADFVHRGSDRWRQTLSPCLPRVKCSKLSMLASRDRRRPTSRSEGAKSTSNKQPRFRSVATCGSRHTSVCKGHLGARSAQACPEKDARMPAWPIERAPTSHKWFPPLLRTTVASCLAPLRHHIS